jgi:glycosyltransferase involved in cell wall biosynthesis
MRSQELYFDIETLFQRKLFALLASRRVGHRSRPVMLCTNSGYYPWQGGAEYVVQKIAEHMTAFCDVYVAVPANIRRPFNEHNGVTIFEAPDLDSFRRFVRRLCPDVLFCNMIYNHINYANLKFYATLNALKVMNPIGGAYRLDEKWMAKSR